MEEQAEDDSCEDKQSRAEPDLTLQRPARLGGGYQRKTSLSPCVRPPAKNGKIAAALSKERVSHRGALTRLADQYEVILRSQVAEATLDFIHGDVDGGWNMTRSKLRCRAHVDATEGGIGGATEFLNVEMRFAKYF